MRRCSLEGSKAVQSCGVACKSSDRHEIFENDDFATPQDNRLTMVKLSSKSLIHVNIGCIPRVFSNTVWKFSPLVKSAKPSF
jgi:hypothetical protein